MGTRLFSYNSHHQQTKVETETGNVQENSYDAEYLRFELLENGRHTSFVYHNGELLHEERLKIFSFVYTEEKQIRHKKPIEVVVEITAYLAGGLPNTP